MRATPERVASDYRRMAQSAREHGRDEWAEHWEAKAELVLRTRKVRLTRRERARLGQAA